MGDLIFVLITLAFFGVSLLFISGCEWFVNDTAAARPESAGERERSQPQAVN